MAIFNYHFSELFWFIKRVTNKYYEYVNCIKLTLFGVTYGNHCVIHGNFSLRVNRGATVSIGNNFCFICGRALNPLSRNSGGVIKLNAGAFLSIGEHVGISSSVIWVHHSIHIGDYVKIGANTILMDSDCHSLNYLERRNHEADMKGKKNSGIVIGNDVLIGANCIILKGVSIGERSIIGAGSVVTKDIPADCIAAGNPCRVIRKLLREKI